MDFDFIYDFKNKTHRIEISGEFSPISQFLNLELATKSLLTSELNSLINELENRDTGTINFTEWSIEFDIDEVRIFHHTLLSDDELEQETDGFLDWQFEVNCGKGDFIGLLLSWIDFIEN